MSRFGEAAESLARACADLLRVGPTQREPLAAPEQPLAARDVLLGQVRELVAAVTGARPAASDVSTADAFRDPAGALHAALQHMALARPDPHGAAVAVPLPETPTRIELMWRDAARACLELEPYVDALGRLPDDTAWQVLDELADIAAALPALDSDLARLLANDGRPVPEPLLDLDSHSQLAAITDLLHNRIADHLGSTRPLPPPLAAPARRPALQLPAGVTDLPTTAGQIAAAVAHRHADLTSEEMQAVARALAEGAACLAYLLERPDAPPEAWVPVAAQLRRLTPAAERLRAQRTATLHTVPVAVPAAARAIRAHLDTLAELARRLPSRAPNEQWQRLAQPALHWAETVAPTVDALHDSLLVAIRQGRVLHRNDNKHIDPLRQWEPVKLLPAAQPPPVLAAALELRSQGRAVGAAAHSALSLTREAAVRPKRSSQAPGLARRQLRDAIAERRRGGNLRTLPPLGATPREAGAIRRPWTAHLSLVGGRPPGGALIGLSNVSVLTDPTRPP